MSVDPAAAPLPDAPLRSPVLLSICLAELLERYGSYLIGALLPLFLNEEERLPPAQALRLVGYYLALGYAGGVLGGFASDRFFGYRGATRLGGALFTLGAALLASARPGTLYPALALLILGSSCFKPALTAWLGSLYAPGDPRQSTGFAWYYFAANVGAVAAPFIGGAVRTRYSWPLSFLTTAFAFGLCLIVVIVGQTAWRSADLPPRQQPRSGSAPPGTAASASGDAAVRTPRWRTLAVLLWVVVLFSVAYGQSGGALLFFARDQVDRRIFGWVIPPDFFASVPAAMVLILTALQQGVWQTLRRRRRAPQPAVMLSIGMFASAVAFGLLAAVSAARAGSAAPQPLINALWIIVALTLLTVGEVLVIPVGMALVAQSAPPRQGAMAQGLLSAALAVGFALAGEAGRFLTRWGAPRFFAVNALIPVFGASLLWIGAQLRQSRSVEPSKST